MQKPGLRARSLSWVILFCPLALSCRAEKTKPAKPSEQPVLSQPPPAPAEATPTYRSVPIEGMRSVIRLMSGLGHEGFLTVLRINRLDLGHVRQGDALIVPREMKDLLAYSPFPPELERARPVPKLILVSLRVQALAAYESGRQVHWAPTSTGKQTTPTPQGLFHTNWKSRERASTEDERWLLRWYFNLDNFRGISFHQYDLPGYPASHACVRLLEEDASWTYTWAEQWILSSDGRSILAHGTAVIIFGVYDYGGAPPSNLLTENPAVASVRSEEVDAVLGEHLATILARGRARELLLAGSAPESSRR